MNVARSILLTALFYTLPAVVLPAVAQAQMNAAPAQNAPLAIPSAVANKLAIHKVPPHYPEAAKAGGIVGSVVVQVAISRKGTVSAVSAVSGPVELQQAAVEAVTQWTFRPYLQDGVAADVESTITINFAIQRM